jgi:D-glycero-alpha-D-manno-heptose-7-phosphate kinase
MVVIRATAPVRVCDAGGWTDTWFAREGLTCSIAMTPGAGVSLELQRDAGPVALHVGSTGERYEVPRAGNAPGRHPLLEAALQRHPVPDNRAAEITVGAAVPPGCGVGTSAAVVVALVHALSTARGEVLLADALACDAHGIETGLGLQSGVQDQYASTRGGANLIRIGPYPTAVVEPLDLGDDLLDTLDRQLITVYFGAPHHSSRVHEQVIASLANRDAAFTEARLEPLRRAAADAASALRAGDLAAYGYALTANTRAQADLHASLVNDDAHRLIELAARNQALGWKVNGAGAEGGSVTVVASPDDAARTALIASIDDVEQWQRLALRCAREGARVQAAS